MPTPDVLEGFEHAVADDASVPSGTGLVSSITGTGFSFVTGFNGGKALRITQPAGTATNWRQDWPTAQFRAFAGRFRLPSGAPSVDESNIFGINSPTGTNMVRGTVRSAANGGFMRMQVGGGTRQTTNIDVTDGEWHLLECMLTSNDVTWNLDWYVDGTHFTDVTDGGNSATDSSRIFFGSATSTHDYTVDWDDVIGSVTGSGSDHPIVTSALTVGQNYYIFGSNPNADGTPVLNSDSPTNSNTIIAEAPGSMFSKVDDWATTIDTSTYITYTSTVTGAAAGNYVEVELANLPTGTVDVWGVMGNAACFAAGTGTNNMTVRVVDSSGTQLTDIVAGDVSETSLRYFRALIAAPGSGWFSGFNGVKVRIGFSSDTNALPRCSAVMLQALLVYAQPQTVTLGTITNLVTPGTLAVTQKQVVLSTLDYSGGIQTPQFILRPEVENSFDAGTDGAAISAANSGGGSGDAFDAVTVSVGSSVTYDAANALHGGMCMACDPAPSAIGYVEYRNATIGAQANWYGRFYIKAPTIPFGASVVVCDLRDSTTAVNRSRVSFTSSGQLRITDAAGGVVATSTAVLTAGAWARVEFHFFGDPTVGMLEAKLFKTVESTSPTETISGSALNTGGTVDRIRFGQDTSPATDIGVFYLDELALSATGYPGPYVPLPKSITLGTISNLVSAQSLAVGMNVTLGTISNIPTAEDLAVTGASLGQSVFLSTIQYGWEEPWGGPWGGTGAQVFDINVRRGINLGTIEQVGTPVDLQINPNTVTLATLSYIGANPALDAVKMQLNLDTLDYSNTIQDLVVAFTQEVTLDTIEQVGTPEDLQINPQTVTLGTITSVSGIEGIEQVQFSVTLDTLDYAGSPPIDLQNVGFGIGELDTLDYAGAIQALAVGMSTALDTIDNLGTTQTLVVLRADTQAVTLDTIDNLGEAIEPSEFGFAGSQEIQLGTINNLGVTEDLITIRPLRSTSFKRGVYNTRVVKKGGYSRTIRKRGKEDPLA